MSRYTYAPNLYSEDRVGTYFSLLPDELLKLISYYYFYPVSIHVSTHDLQTSKSLISIYRQSGPKNYESISMKVNLSLFLNSLEQTNSYKPKNMAILLFANTLSISSINYPYPNRIDVNFDEYETTILLQKLHFINDQLRKYINLGLNETAINTRLTRYVY